MKINGLGRSVIGLLAIVFVGNVFSMVMTPKEREKAKVAAQKMMTQIKEQQQQIKLQQERAKQYQPGKYFVYEQGTSKGVLVDQKLLEENSEMVKSMVTDLGSRPQEIFLPFPINDIKFVVDVFEDKVALNNLSLEQLVPLYNIEDYLFADKQQKKTFDAIINIIRNIYSVIGEKDFLFSDSWNQERASKASERIRNIFKNYSGKMIPIIPGSKDMIPDYNVLKMLVQEPPREWKKEFGKNIYYTEDKRLFIEKSIVESISYTIERLEREYNNRYNWIAKTLGIVYP